MDFSSPEGQAHLLEICSALLCLIGAGSAAAGETLREKFGYITTKCSLVDFLGSSPWLFTVRLELGRVLQTTEGQTQLGKSREVVCSLLKNVCIKTITGALGSVLTVLCSVGVLCWWNYTKTVQNS
jgi:hypothetical protein